MSFPSSGGLSYIENLFNNLQNQLPVGTYTGFRGGNQFIFTAGNGQNAIGPASTAASLGLVNLQGQATVGPYSGSTITNTILSPNLPNTTGTNLKGSTAGSNAAPAITNSGAATDSLTTAFNSGITQAKTFLENHPEVLLIGGGIALLLLLKK